MTLDPWTLLEHARTVLAVHAHPDDESLATGALISALTTSGTRVELVTATRGEEGEVVPGVVAPGDTRELEEIREAEIDAATTALGIARRYWLGTPPALAAPPSGSGSADGQIAPSAGAANEPGGLRRYRDSGMQWLRPGLAGPSDSAGPDSFTHRPLEEAAADLAALIEHLRPDAVVGYDDAGTYGHPDHVRAHEVTARACALTGTPRIEVASTDGADGFAWREHPATRAAVRRALEAYGTQLTVGEDTEDGLRIRHVGGQDDLVLLRTGLRLGG